MARRSLVINWKDLNESERQQFVHFFIRVLRDGAACRVNDYTMAQVSCLSDQHEGHLQKDVPFSEEIRWILRLMNRSGHWLMYDTVIGGISLGSNYRAQSVQVMRESSYAGLVDRLEAKTLLHKTFERLHTP